MKIGLNLKLAIGILLVFGLLLLGMALYHPVWYRVHRRQLESKDTAAREAAADAVAARGAHAIPYIRRWLRSNYEPLITGACLVLEKMEGDTWEDALPELGEILDGLPSARTDEAASVFIAQCFDYWTVYYSEKYPARYRNVEIYLLSNSDHWLDRCYAAEYLGDLGDKCAIEPLYRALQTEYDDVSFVGKSIEALVKIDENLAVEPLISLLGNNTSWTKRYDAVIALGEIADRRAVEPLINVFQNDPAFDVRVEAIIALGKIGDPALVEILSKILLCYKKVDFSALSARALWRIQDARAIEPLTCALKNNSNYMARHSAARALGDIGEAVSVEPLISALENDSVGIVRSGAARALGRIGNERAVEALASAIWKEQNSWTVDRIATALGIIGTGKALEPLIAFYENASSMSVEASISFATFRDERVTGILRKARDNKNITAAIALGWQNGVEDLVIAEKMINPNIGDEYREAFHACTRARWGDASEIDTVISQLLEHWNFLERFYMDVFSRMPEGFPEYDYKANYAVRNKQIKTMNAWYDKNKDRLAWDAKARRYCLQN
jgi:HEAT repeat protein